MSDLRNKHMDFVNSMVKKSKEKEEAKPNSLDTLNVSQIEELTKKLREEIPDKLKKRY
ncbi:hypothetical protein J4404_00055 [Candidatus Woesearchaeota archaeon]|nr:hypothetical protein [Candidatus Woesearchaeota archaeon]